MLVHRQSFKSIGFSRINRYGLPIYVLGDQLDFHLCQELLDELQVDIDSGCRAIAVDLRSVARLEPSAAWLLVTVQQFMRKRNRRFMLLDPQPRVGRTLAEAWSAVSSAVCKN